MLQKGIIETIEDKYTVKVRVPKYDKLESSATGTRYEDLATGIVCTLPGMNVTYSVGDIVLVDFENDELSKPVILGLLYRDHESKSVLELKGIDSSIETINEKISDLSSKSLYTHIKYSNDGGMTFTSLYDPSTVIENTDYTVSPKDKLSINTKIEAVYWSIIDENNIDITTSIPITTTISGYNPVTEFTFNQSFTDYSIEVPIIFQACTEAYIDFNIQIPKEEASKYYIVLTTDLNSIGSVYGDYIGVSVSNSVTPSINTIDYSWTSLKERNDLYIQHLKEELLPRIQANELDIRGYTEEYPNDDTGNGLLDAIIISLETILLGYNRSKVYFGTTKQYISPGDSSIHINTVIQEEFELKRVSKSSTSHLMLYYNEG